MANKPRAKKPVEEVDGETVDEETVPHVPEDEVEEVEPEEEAPAEEAETAEESPEGEAEAEAPAEADAPQVNHIAREVLAGKWGTADERDERLTTSGYDPAAIQARIDEILDPDSPDNPTYSVQQGETLAKIAAKLNYPGGWKALHAKNRGNVGDNPASVPAGSVLAL